jgi:AhpD family alkylhydroperoxidase
MPEAFAKLAELETIAKGAGLEPKLVNLVKLRASQINQCAFCTDMHVKEAKIEGERELRLHHLAVWRESPLFTPREKAALRWAEAATKLSQGDVTDEDFAEARRHLSEKELVALTLVAALINAWNRFAVAFRAEPGSKDRAFGLDKAGL